MKKATLKRAKELESVITDLENVLRLPKENLRAIGLSVHFKGSPNKDASVEEGSLRFNINKTGGEVIRLSEGTGGEGQISGKDLPVDTSLDKLKTLSGLVFTQITEILRGVMDRVEIDLELLDDSTDEKK